MILKTSVTDIVPSRINGFPLKINQQIVFYFILPTLVTLLLYVLNISVDVVVGIKLIRERKNWGGIITLIIVCVPSVLDYIYQINYTKKIFGVKERILWNVFHLADLFLFPLHIVICLFQQLYLAIGALKLEDPQREEQLQKLIKNKKETQVYQFFHAFLHALPQASLQLYFLLDKTASKSIWTRGLQICSVFTSLLIASLGVQMYHRYESKKVIIASNAPPNPIHLETATTENNNNEENAERQQPEATQEDRTTQELLHNETLKRNFSQSSEETRPIHYYESDDDYISRTVLFLAWYLFIVQRVFTIVPALKYCPTITVVTVLAHYILITIFLTLRENFYKKLHYILFLGYVHLFGIIEIGIKIRRVVAYHILFYILVIVEDILLNLLWYNYGKWRYKIHYHIFIMNYACLILGPVLMLFYFRWLKK